MAKKAAAFNSDETPHVQSDQETAPRLYKGSQSLDHDLFKLDLARFQRNKSFMPNDAPDIEMIEHVHFFHSVDSSGRPQGRSNMVGGHFHEMKLVKAATDTTPAVYAAGPACRELRSRSRGKVAKRTGEVVVFQDKDENGRPIEGGEKIVDSHTHEVVYLRSNKIAKRVENAEAIGLIAHEANKTAPIPGVVG